MSAGHQDRRADRQGVPAPGPRLAHARRRPRPARAADDPLRLRDQLRRHQRVHRRHRPGQDPASAAYLRSYASSDFFRVVGTGENLADADDAFDRNEARIAVVVPSGFGRSLAAGEQATVAVYLDGS